MNKFAWPTLGLAALCLVFAGCQATPPSTEDREVSKADAKAALKKLQATDPELEKFLNNAYGYVIFPSVGKGGVIVGGAFGRGELYEKHVTGFHLAGYATVEQATIGAQLGGQSYTELIAFETKTALERFQSGKFAFSANASAVALKSGAAATAKYENGVAVFTITEGGLMFEASIGGQKFKYEPKP